MDLFRFRNWTLFFFYSYVDSQVLREEGLKKPERVTVERKKPNGQIVPYHIVDSVSQFKQTDW